MKYKVLPMLGVRLKKGERPIKRYMRYAKRYRYFTDAREMAEKLCKLFWAI